MVGYLLLFAGGDRSGPVSGRNRATTFTQGIGENDSLQLEDELDHQLHVEFLAGAEARSAVEVADRVTHHAKSPADVQWWSMRSSAHVL